MLPAAIEFIGEGFYSIKTQFAVTEEKQKILENK